MTDRKEGAGVNSVLVKWTRGALWCSVVSICVLTFVWPFIVSRDPDQPVFKITAIAVLLLFLLSMLVLLSERLASKR